LGVGFDAGEKSPAPLIATATASAFESREDSTLKRGACGAGLYVMSNSQNNIVMTDENKIIGDAFAIFV